MKSSRAPVLSVSAELSRNLDSALALGSSLHIPPVREVEEALERVNTVVDFQSSRVASQKTLQPIIAALHTPPEQRPALLDRLGVAPLQVDGLVVGDADCPLALLPRPLQALSTQARRHHVALQMLLKSNFAPSCIEALLRQDHNGEMDGVLVVVASQALYLRAHATVLGAPMPEAVYAGLLRVVHDIWAGGINPDQRVRNFRQGFAGSLVEQAIALGDVDAVLMLLASKWKAVDRALVAFDTKHQGKTAFESATPFIDPWLDAIIESPLRPTHPETMAQLARKLVEHVGDLMQSKSAALRDHFCSQVLIRAGACKDAVLYRAVLEGLLTHNSYSNTTQLGAMMQFCVLACWHEGVQVMLEHGVSPNARLTEAWMVLPDIAVGLTALSLAACCSDPSQFEASTQIIELLLRHGADPRIGVNRSTHGYGAVLLQTPLHIALEVGNRQAAKCLLKAELDAPQTFAAQDRQTLAKMHRLLRATFFTKRGASVVPTYPALRRLAAAFCAATMNNFHLQAGANSVAQPRFDEIGRFSVRLAEYIDPLEISSGSRANKKDSLMQWAKLQVMAQALLADWPASGPVALPAEFEPETSLAHLHGAKLLTSKQINDSINGLFCRFITLDYPQAAQLWLDLYPATATHHLCMGAALIIRKTAHKQTSKDAGAAYAKLLHSMIGAIRDPHGMRVLIEICCLLETPTGLQHVLQHAEAHGVDWPSARSAEGLHRNVLHLAVGAPEGMLVALLDAIPQAQRTAWLTQQDEQGDTPLHLAARLSSTAYKPILDALGDGLRCDIENMTGHCVAVEALLHGHLQMFEAVTRGRVQPVESRILGQAIVAQPRTRRLSFIRSLERSAQLTKDRPEQLDAVFAHVIARSDAHALRTLIDCYTPHVTEPEGNRKTILHMATKRAATGMVQHLRNALSTTDFERLARCRDDANCYPEDYADSPPLHRYLRALRRRARDGVVLELESKYMQTLTPLVDAIATAENAGSQSHAAIAFVKRAEAIAARKDIQAIDCEALGLLAWQVLDMLAAAPGSGCGAHYAAHRPDVSLQQLRRRFDAFGSQGASRFGSGDALALLRLRHTALQQAAAEASDEGYAPSRTILEFTDKQLQGEGYVRNQTSGEPIAYEKSPHVRFVLEASKRGLIIVSCYPIAELTSLP